MQIPSFLIFFPGSNNINQNPNLHAIYAFDPGICILQQLVLSAKLATKMACLCLWRIGEAISDIKSLIYQKNSMEIRKSFEHCQLITAWHTPHQTWTCVELSKI